MTRSKVMLLKYILRKFNRRTSFIPIAIALIVFSCSATQANFRAAVVTVDITPDTPKMLLGYGARKSIGVRDHIYHKIVVMDDGNTTFVMVSSDLGAISPDEYDQTANLLQRQLKISPANFWWAVTHTHSAPEVGEPGLIEVFLKERFEHSIDSAYTQFVRQALLAGVQQAIQKLQAATLTVGWGFSQANINRRAIGSNGKASLGMNPEGATDRKIGLLTLKDKAGKAIALLANYPVHGTVYGPDNLYISGDVAGVVSAYVEKQTGAPVLFINGAAGNLAPLYSVDNKIYGSKKSELDQMCVFLGDRIIEAYNTMGRPMDSVKLFTGELMIETPRKEHLQWPASLQKYSRTTGNGTNLIRLPARFLRINEEVAIWSTPAELFCEISNEIRDRSPFPYTFYFGYTNGWLGYLPTEKEWQFGGYEVEMVSPYTPAVEKKLKKSVLGYLHGELKSKNEWNQFF